MQLVTELKLDFHPSVAYFDYDCFILVCQCVEWCCKANITVCINFVVAMKQINCIQGTVTLNKTVELGTLSETLAITNPFDISVCFHAFSAVHFQECTRTCSFTI